MKRPILPYILPILVIIIFLIGMSACEKRELIGSPDIRKEHIEGDKPDYFGWKWKFEW